MKMTNQCLAIFVVALCLGVLSGCNILAGAQNCEFGTLGFGCAPNPDASGDGSSGSDGSSSPETSTNSEGVTNDTIGQQPDTGPPVDVCAPYMYLQGTSWTCHAGAAVAECVLVVTALESGVCDVKCPKVWHVDAATILFPSADKLVYDLHIADAPAVPCFKKVN